MGSGAVGQPTPERWRWAGSAWVGGCSDRSKVGFTSCLYFATGRRALADLVRDGHGLARRTFVWTQVHPSFCPWAQAEPFARDMMIAEAKRLGARQRVVFARADGRLFGSTDTLRMVWVAREGDLVWIQLHSPAGIGAWERAEFDALVSTIRSVERSRDGFRRALWLHSHPAHENLPLFPWAQVPACGVDRDERRRLERAYLVRATHEQPEDFEPWVYLGVEAERHGAPGHPLSYFFAVIGHGAGRAPVDRGALHEADEFYAQALARNAPPGSRDPGDVRESVYPSDVPSLWAARGRALAKSGDDAGAARHYETALAFDEVASWGRLEAAVWLAERAYRRRDWTAARALYERAEQAWRVFYGDGFTLSGMGEPFYLRIAARRRELGKRN